MAALSESQKIVADRYTDLVDSWGLALAYAITQSVELSEKIVTNAIVASIAAGREETFETSPRDELLSYSPVKPIVTPNIPPSLQAVRFAAVVWELARPSSYQPFGGGLASDAFFRLPALSRAVVVLKTRARFSRHQIAAALKLSVTQIDQTLEHARSYFSDGRSWIQAEAQSTDRHCPEWLSSRNTSDLASRFAKFAGHDMESKESRELQQHLFACESCRKNFSQFKKQYDQWTHSVPAVATGTDLKRHLRHVTKMALRLKTPSSPSPWPGLRRLLRSTRMQLLLAGTLVLLIAHWFLTHSNH